ncbi:Asp23/Gls24 family envelope stress response protein [Pseudokineococcus basanitobsidens]|uniref:Asp23/Gls24 family envelope stress response protein n=1 Tax=Pseudokineococcus basanitobsidens TaxID=1926649 RepID=A0ABU8RNE6_9ACTN
MADTATAPGAADRGAGPASGADDPGDRGGLDVADRVLERIARRAVGEVDGVAPSASGGLAGLLGSGYPSVEVQHAGGRVRVLVDVASLWPRPAASVAAGVREAVARRLSELAAVRVDAVQVTVRDVVRPRPPQEARVR